MGQSGDRRVPAQSLDVLDPELMSTVIGAPARQQRSDIASTRFSQSVTQSCARSPQPAPAAAPPNVVMGAPWIR